MTLSTTYLSTLDIHESQYDLAFIQNLQEKHLEHFTFNSLAVVLQQNPSTDIDELNNKIVQEKKGGYCFEHNKLFFTVLQELGYTVRPLLGRVLNNQDIEAPRTHRLTLLEYQNEHYLVDVGFGYICPTSPVSFSNTTTTRFGYQYKIRKENEHYLLQVLSPKGDFTLYSFELHACTEPDFEMGHFYSHQYPKATFVNNLVISRITANTIHSLRNSVYQQITMDSTSEIPIKTPQKLQSILKKEFHYPLDLVEVKSLFQQFCTQWFVYVLECNDNTLYTGITTDVQRRENEHNHSPKGAKYTKIRRPVKVVYTQKCNDRSEASKREHEIKHLKREEKLKLIQGESIAR
jgi:N-hydroxyarylamine O-acetyltransferase